MPCRDDWGPADFAAEQHKKIGQLTAMLCQACQAIEDSRVQMPGDCIVWWEAHKAADRARMEREMAEARRNALRRSALEKLTAEERAVLGIPLNG